MVDNKPRKFGATMPSREQEAFENLLSANLDPDMPRLVRDKPPKKSDLDTSLGAAYKSYYRQRKRRDSWHQVRKRTYHSSSGGKCQKAQWAKNKGLKSERKGPPNYGIFDRGHMAEAHVRNVFSAKWGAHHVLNDVEIEISSRRVRHDYPGDSDEKARSRPIVVVEPKFPKGMKVVGKADPTIIGMNLRPLAQTEIKSTAKFELPTEAELPHIYQVTTYAHAVMDTFCTDRELRNRMVEEDPTVPEDAWPFTIPPIDCDIYYIDPANYDSYKCFSFPYHPRLWKKVRDWYLVQHEANETDTVPEATTKNVKECEYCDFRKWCGSPLDKPNRDGPRKFS